MKAAEPTSDSGVPGGPYPLSWLEVVFGSPLGVDESIATVEPRGEPASTLEALVVEALNRPPCVVTFSGGRDSSAVLAAAVAAARDHGLPLPIPSTMRFPHLEDSVEDEWQERVVRHLGLTDWQIIEPGPGLGFLGSVAVDVLETSGLVWPPNAHFMMPSVRSAAGGSVLTGAFGDEIFTEDPRRSSARRSRYESLPRSLRDVARVAVTAGPRRVRSWDARRRLRVLPLPVWLTDQAGDTVRTGLADLAAVAPLRWDHAAITFPRLRYQNAGVAALEALGSLTDTVVTAPLGDARFVAAVANEAGKLGFTDRTAAMRRLFGHLLPDEVLSRSTKASFGRALWGPEAAEFAEAWDGSGIPEDLAEAEVLRATWRAACDMSAPVPAHAFQSAMALHAAYVVAA